MNPIMSHMNDIMSYEVPVVDCSAFHNSTPPQVSTAGQPSVLYTVLSFITIWRVILLLLMLGNIKNIPFIWHLRIVNAFRFCLKTQRPKVAPTCDQLFQPLITTSHAPLMEIDFNLHKTNSSYFSDIDIARTHLVCTLFSVGIEHMRGGTAAITGAKKPMFGCALGAVSCSFRRELKPYESYELWTRILSWDEKWIYIVTHFVRKGAVRPREFTLYPQQNSTTGSESKPRGKSSRADSAGSNEAVVATALSKCVFKQGRRTVSPAYMLRESGLLPTKSLDDALPDDSDSVPLDSCTSSDSGIDVADEKGDNPLARVERERRRGMKVAMSLAAQAQNDLEMEFTAENEALGGHMDGIGLIGVVSTLAQLAHLKRKQIL